MSDSPSSTTNIDNASAIRMFVNLISSFVILIGIILAIGGVFGGVLVAASGILFLPKTRGYITRLTPLATNRNLKIAAAIILPIGLVITSIAVTKEAAEDWTKSKQKILTKLESDIKSNNTDDAQRAINRYSNAAKGDPKFEQLLANFNANKARLEAEKKKAETQKAEEVKPATNQAKATENALGDKEELKFPLKIYGYGLGKLNTPCRIKTVTETSHRNPNAKMVTKKCELNDFPSRSTIEVRLSLDEKTVVEVRRLQYLYDIDPSPFDVLNSAVKYFGEPTASNPNNMRYVYGDAYRIINNSGDEKVEFNTKGGVGLLIQGLICSLKPVEVLQVRCEENLRADWVIIYELIDVDGVNKRVIDGEAEFNRLTKQKAENQRY